MTAKAITKTSCATPTLRLLAQDAKKTQIVNVQEDRRLVLNLPNGESLLVDYSKGSKRWLTMYPDLKKTHIEIYGKVPHLRTTLGQKIENYQMTPLTEKDFD